MNIRSLLIFYIFAGISLPAAVSTGWKYQVAPAFAGPLPQKTVTGTPITQNNQTVVNTSVSAQTVSVSSFATLSPPVGNVADEITPEIQNLAAGLQNDPVRIFEFVYNAIEYEHYYGSKKGAHLTLLEGSGNDADQAALLVALLRAAGQPAKYLDVYTLVPYDNSAPFYSGTTDTMFTGVSWLGLDPVPYPGLVVSPIGKPAGWSDDEVKKSINLSSYFKNAGFPVAFDSANKSCIWAYRKLVRTTLNGVSVILDPSAKLLTGKSRMDLLNVTNFNKTNFLTAIGGTSTSTSVSGLNYSAIQSQLVTATNKLNTAIRNSRPNDSVRDILGRKENLSADFGNNINRPKLHGIIQVDNADTIPDAQMSSLVIQIDTNPAYSIKMPALQGKRLSVTSTGNTVQVWQDDTVVHSATVAAATYTLKMSVKHPHFAQDNATPIHDADDGGKVYKKSASYALIYAFAPSKRLLQSRQRILDGYIEAVRALNPALVGADGAIDLPNLSDVTLKRQVTTELLNIMGLNWLYQTEQTNQMAASVNSINLCMFHRFGRMAQEAAGGFYIDVPLSYSNSYPKNGLNDNVSAYALTSAYLFSALEHGVIDQYNLSANGAVSTVQMMHLANASTDTTKNRVYQLTAANWSTVQSQLIGYGTLSDPNSQLSQLKAKADSGSIIYLPINANSGSAGWTWTGSGYVEFNPTAFTIGMLISGGYAGGYSITSTYINPAPVYKNYVSAPNYYDTGSVSNVINRTTPAYNVPSFFGADPVDMATGAMVFNKEDLALGSPGVRGLSFQRHYNSNRRNSNASKLGYGWTHNYDMKAVLRTAAEAGLGETTPYEAAQMMAAVTMINELIKDTTAPKQMVSAALLAKIAVDNLLNNAVAITMGKESVQFIKQPDGTYTAPAGSKMSLSKSGDFYLATERFGNTYKFDTANDGRVTQITDFFNKTLGFTYNTDGLSVITDAYSRSLTFGYTSGQITSITDSTGRTVQFGYSSKNLTSVTDPENKSSSFIYDAGHRLTQLKDPQNRTIVTNRYDSENRVYEQDSEGDSAKTWRISYSGLRNTENNPQGGKTVYFYDKRGRPTGVQDALGNRTSMTYDGQDHMIERRTAKNEIYTQLFTADHDISNSENPIGVKTLYLYDSLKRVIQVILRDNDNSTPDRITNIEYASGNTSNLPNTITDANGNVSKRTYYVDGNLNTTTEESVTGNRTTTYLYDVRGLPSKTTYPDATFEVVSYGIRGDMDSQTDRRGNTTTYLYNNRRQQTRTTPPGTSYIERAYDDSGNLLSVTDQVGNVTRYTYSATGKTLTETMAFGTASAATTTRHYDTRDWQDYILDSRNQKTAFTFDAAGRVVSITDPLNQTVSYQYDANGKRTSTRTPLVNTTQTTYTALGQENTITDPANITLTYGYNSYGERASLQNRRSNTFQFFYDANGNPTVTQTPLNFAVTTNWNDRNLIGSVVKASNQTTTYVYDSMRRVQTQTDPVGTVSFVYDKNGNPLTVTQGTAVLTRTWDALNRPQSYTNALNQSIGYQYYDNGLLRKITYPGDRVVTYTYYPTNKLKTVVDWANRTTTYTWDVAGRLTGITRPNGVTRTNVFDNANRLERIYERDGANRLLVYFKYGFDADSQITSRYRLPQPKPFTLPVNAATYDADNRIQVWNGQSVVHDSDGNMTSGPLGAVGLVNYNYDARNRLTSVGTVASGFTYYGYDSENNRISVTTTAGVTKYLIDPHGDALPRVLVREKPDASKTTYVYGIGLLYEVNDTTGDATYYHFDGIGNTAALTGPTGTLTDRVEYSPYGQVTYRMGTTDTPFLYVGQLGVQQEANGLLYMRARYYSPQLMRFVNADPIGFAGGMNFYSYAGNSPLMFVDPSGNVFGTPLTYGEFFSAAGSGAAQGAIAYGRGFAVGAATGAVVVGGAALAVTVGAPAAVVTGGLFAVSAFSGGAAAYSIYKDPSADNIAYNLGAVGGGTVVGGLTARGLTNILSPAGSKLSIETPAVSEQSQAWLGSDGKPSLSTMLFKDYGTAMATGPTAKGMTGAVAATSVVGADTLKALSGRK